MIEEKTGSPSCEVVLLNQYETHTTKSNPCIMHIQILVVDDDPTCLSIVAELLKRCSPSEGKTRMRLSVRATKSSLEALRALREDNNYDVVVMSLHMQEVNGMEFQRQVVRELKVPVIVMSADDDEHLMLKTLEDGAISYLLKPIKKQDVKNVWQCAITAKKGKSAMVEEENDGSCLNIEKIPYHDTKTTLSVNNDINSNGGQQSIVSKVESKRGRKRRAKEDHKRRDSDDDGELQSHAKNKRSKVVWTSALHTRFLLAVNHIGLDKAVPKTILQFMGVPGLTRENIASHLQKYRIFLKKLSENGGIYPSTLSQRTVRSFASNSSLLYRRIKLEDLDTLSRRRLNPLFQPAYTSSNLFHLRQHKSHVFRLQESSNYQTRLLQFGGIRGNLTNSNQGFSRFGDTSSCYNIGSTSKIGRYGYNQISGNSYINTQVNMMGRPYPSQKLNFNSYTDTQLNGTSYDVIGASKPSFNGSVGLLPNVGFVGANLGLQNWVSNGNVNVAPTLPRNESSGCSYASQLPSLSTNPFPCPFRDDNNQDSYLGLSTPLCQELNFVESSNGGMNNHDVIDMMGNTSTNLANDAPSFGEYMFNHELLDDIEKSGLQYNNSIAPSSVTNQQQDGVTKLTFSSDISRHGTTETSNLVAQSSYPNLSNELSHHTEQTVDLEALLDASNRVNPTNFDDKSNSESEFHFFNDMLQEDGATKFTFSSDNYQLDAVEMNNFASQLSQPDIPNELSDHIKQTTNLEVLLDASSQAQGTPECINPTNVDDRRSNFETGFNPIHDKQQGASDGGTVELNSNNSFLADIEALLENKDWADQFIECLHENEDWTSF